MSVTHTNKHTQTHTGKNSDHYISLTEMSLSLTLSLFQCEAGGAEGGPGDPGLL